MITLNLFWKFTKLVLSLWIEYWIFVACDYPLMRYTLDPSLPDEYRRQIWLIQAGFVYLICTILIVLIGYVPIMLFLLGTGSLYAALLRKDSQRQRNPQERERSSSEHHTLSHRFHNLESNPFARIEDNNSSEFLISRNKDDFLPVAFANIFSSCAELRANLISCKDSLNAIPTTWQEECLSIILKWLERPSCDNLISHYQSKYRVPFECPLKFYRRLLDEMESKLSKTMQTTVFTYQFRNRFRLHGVLTSQSNLDIRELMVKVTTLLEENKLNTSLRWEYLRLYSDLAWTLACRSESVILGLFYCQILVTWSCGGCGSYGLKTCETDILELDWNRSQLVYQNGYKVCKVQLAKAFIEKYAIPGGCANCPMWRAQNTAVRMYLTQKPTIIAVQYSDTHPPSNFIQISDVLHSHDKSVDSMKSNVLRLRCAITSKQIADSSRYYQLAVSIDNRLTWTMHSLDRNTTSWSKSGHGGMTNYPSNNGMIRNQSIDNFLRMNGGRGHLLFFSDCDHF